MTRIVELADEGFYDGVVFHRVIQISRPKPEIPQEQEQVPLISQNLKQEFSDEKHTQEVLHLWQDPVIQTVQILNFLYATMMLVGSMGNIQFGEKVDGMEHIDSLKKELIKRHGAGP